jgi:carboxymethylenebutenolidase
MSSRVTVPSSAGGSFEAALSEPAGSTNAGGVVVVQEWHGVNEYVRSTCDRLAHAGFLALAPDLYRGAIATSDQQAAQMMHALDEGAALTQIGDAVRYLAAHPRNNGRVAVLGFCMGGALAFTAARRVEGLTAAVVFYGIPSKRDELARIPVPVLAHFAKKDDWAKASVAREIQEAIRRAGGQMELHLYDAGHAFMRTTDPRVYEPASAKQAWDRTMDFLRPRLGDSPK